MNDQPIHRREAIRSFLCSRPMRVLLALCAFALCVGLALALWHGRDLLAGCLFVTLVLFGIHLAWELLPLSATTRARWARSRALAERYLSYRYRSLLWVGVGFAIPPIWKSVTRGTVNPWEFLLPALFLATGALAHLVGHFKHRSAHPKD